MDAQGTGTEGALGTNPCPSCGVAVATGYRRCPKCHAELPTSPLSGESARAARVEGGTSVESVSNHTWIYAVGGAAVVATLAVLVVTGSDGEDAKSQSPETTTAEGLSADDADEPDLTAPRAAPSLRRAAPTPRQDDALVRAARLLLGRLEAARMWSTVEVSGPGLAIKSGYCGDAAIGQTLDRLAAELSGLGVAKVTCYERHGPKVFERELVATPDGASSDADGDRARNSGDDSAGVDRR